MYFWCTNYKSTLLKSFNHCWISQTFSEINSHGKVTFSQLFFLFQEECCKHRTLGIEFFFGGGCLYCTVWNMVGFVIGIYRLENGGSVLWAPILGAGESWAYSTRDLKDCWEYGEEMGWQLKNYYFKTNPSTNAEEENSCLCLLCPWGCFWLVELTGSIPNQFQSSGRKLHGRILWNQQPHLKLHQCHVPTRGSATRPRPADPFWGGQ